MELERSHRTNWSGLKLTDEKNGAERVRSEEWQKGSRNEHAGLEEQQEDLHKNSSFTITSFAREHLCK